MEATETETETKKNSKSKKSGAKAASKSVPREISIERVDILTLTLLTERSRRLEAEAGRIKAEQNALQSENLLYVQNLNTKYGVDMNGYSIDLDSGTAKPRD